MPFTGRLGTTDSQLGNIVLGLVSEGGVSAALTADAIFLATVEEQVAADAFLALPGTGSFTADAVIFGTIVSSSFTADSLLISYYLQEDFDSGLGGFVHRSGDTSYNTTNDYLEVLPDTTATLSHPITLEPPNFVRVDFWAPANIGSFADFESHIIHLQTYGRRISIETFDDDKIYVSVDQSPTYSFVPVADTWYRVFAILEQDNGGSAQVYIWPRDQDIPSTPTFTRTYTSVGTVSPGIVFLSVRPESQHPLRADNILIYTLGSYRFNQTFTANALKKRVESRTFSADAVLFDADATIVEGSFSADASLFALNLRSFPANALLLKIVQGSFTANSWLELAFYRFQANAVIKKTVSKSFVANAVIVTTTTNSLTANSVLIGELSKQFAAKAVLVGKLLDPDDDRPRLAKRSFLSVLQRRPVDLGTYVPPRIPDETQQEVIPDCLPPCDPYAAGGSVNGWGAFKVSMTSCSFCGNYFRSDSEYLGRGSAGTASVEHCGYCGAHNRDDHVTKLWVRYPSIPDGEFLMRAKMTWSINGPDFMVVRVYNVGTFPETEPEGCEDAAFSSVWSGGTLVNKFTFINDATVTGYVILGNTEYKYQEEPSTIFLYGNDINSDVFRFELEDENTHYNAKFRAANLEWP